MADLKLRKAAKPALYLLLMGLMALPLLGMRVTRRPTNQRPISYPLLLQEFGRHIRRHE